MLRLLTNLMILIILFKKRIIGCLIYVTNTRSYITFVVHQLSQIVFPPTNHHQQAALEFSNI